MPLGAADTMYFGQDDGYQARIIMRFGLADSALDSVVAVHLVLHPADSTAMGFVCRPCSVSWNANAVSWRLADSVTHWFKPGGDYWDIDLGSGTLAGESLVVELDRSKLDTLVLHSYGIILFPQDTGYAAIHSGYSQETAPRIRLTYADDAEETYNAIEDAHMVDTVGAVSSYDLSVGSGFAFRTHLRFALDSVPQEATVAQAELVFKPTVEYRRRDTLKLGVRRLLEPFGRNASFADWTSTVFDYVADPDSVVRLDIRSLVQFWTAHPDSNFGLLVTAEPEWQMMFRLRVPHSGPDAPKLNLLFVMPPDDRFSG